MGADNYIPITATLLAVTEKAVRIETDNGGPAWIPRSCIHGDDERSIDRTALNSEIALRVFEWKLQREGLI